MTALKRSKQGFMAKLWDSLIAVFIFVITVILVAVVFTSSSPGKQSKLTFESGINSIKATKSANDFMGSMTYTGKRGGELLREQQGATDLTILTTSLNRHFSSTFVSAWYAKVYYPNLSPITFDPGKDPSKQGTVLASSSSYTPLPDGKTAQLQLIITKPNDQIISHTVPQGFK